MDTAARSVVSEGIYIGLVSPDQDEYSTLNQPSLKSPTAQHTEKSVGSPHPYRLIAVCLGLLCALLLAATLVLSVHYARLSQHYSQLERDLEELKTCNNAIKQEGGLLQVGNNTLMHERDQLKKENNVLKLKKLLLQTFLDLLKQKKDQLQRDYRAIFKKLPFMKLFCPLSSQKRECKPCPQGWEQFDSKCYYFSTVKKTWADSHSDCMKLGADLVIIESEEEQDFISKHTKEYYWIGLSDTVTPGTWFWVDGTPLQIAFWKVGEPDNRYTYENHLYLNADCAVFEPNVKTWMDIVCNALSHFICETDALLL